MNPLERIRAQTGRVGRSNLIAVRRRQVSARRARRRQQTRRRRVIRFVLLIVAVFSFMGMGTVAVAWAAYNNYVSQLPDAQQLAADEPALDTHVFAADGSLLHIFHDPDARHEHVALGDISFWLKRATIDTEDKHFYEESSWDLPRIAKAGVTDITGGQTQGASTITQQLAKISFLSTSQQSIDRKIKQLILGNEIDASFGKDQILEMYLNRISYGNFAIGIQTASDLYFHKGAKDLDLAEASLLAGLPQSPSVYDPVVNNAVTVIAPNAPAKIRQKIVLDAMVSSNDITRAVADKAYAEKLTVHPWNDSEVASAPDFVGYLQNYLDQKFGEAYIHPGGWNIYTTLNVAQQKAAETEVHNGISAIRDKNGNDGALVALDPHSGAVQAMVGTWNYADPGTGQLNMAIRMRQPGSTIKLFTYAAALASRQFTMTSPILDAPVTLRPPGSSTTYSPQNYDLRYHGNCQLKVCLGNSFNVPAVKTEVATGIPYISDLEIAAGLSSLTYCQNLGSDQQRCNRPGPYDYAATLGALTYGVTPLDLADGAATLADMGVHHDPAPVTKIVDALTGKTLWTYDPAVSARQVIPADTAFIISEITSNDRNRQPEFPAHGDLTLGDRRVSAKTGTTQFFTDNWTVGWTPQIVTAVWVGNPTQSCLKPEDRDAFANALRTRGNRLGYSGVNITDPFSPQDLARYGFAPVNDHCGHLVGSSGITGAAPIWHKFMVDALTGSAAVWYAKPADVVAHGTGDNADFFMPGSANGTTTNGCWYYAPVANPTSKCTYLGVSPVPGAGSPYPTA